MDKELQKKILDLLSTAQEQVPEVIQDYIGMSIFEAQVWLYIGIFILIIGLFFDYIAIKEEDGAFGTVGASATMLGILVASFNAYHWYTWIHFPKAMLLYYFR